MASASFLLSRNGHIHLFVRAEKGLDKNSLMLTCLLHPKREAEHWTGHVHLRNKAYRMIHAGWCQECNDFEQWQIMNPIVPFAQRERERCHQCCGVLRGFR